MQSVFNSGRGNEQAMCPAFHAFNKENQNWESYLQQLAQHFSAYSVDAEDRRKAYFLSWVGFGTFELLKNLFGTDDLNNYTYKQLTDKLTEHFQAKRHIVAARYDFFKREMRHAQTHREWVADLRGIARECQFVCSANGCNASYLDEVIRDQIIVHTPFDAVRTSALQKLKPTLEEVLIIAETYDTTTKTVSAIKESNEKTVQVHAVQLQLTKKKGKEVQEEKNKLKSCTGCGQSHEREKCKFRDAICHNCEKKGHIAAVCLSKQSKRQNFYNIKRRSTNKQ